MPPKKLNMYSIKSNKPLLIVLTIVGIVILGFIGSNLFLASVIDSTSLPHVTIPAYKQDGSRNMEVVLNEPHILEVYVSPDHTGSIQDWFFIYNQHTGDSYRSANIPYSQGPGFMTIQMTNVPRLDGWGLQYWSEGTNRATLKFSSSDPGQSYYAPFTAYNISREDSYCDGTTYYDNAVYYMGDVTFDEHINSLDCGYVAPIATPTAIATITATATATPEVTSTPTPTPTDTIDTTTVATPTSTAVPGDSSTVPDEYEETGTETSNPISEFLNWITDLLNKILGK